LLPLAQAASRALGQLTLTSEGERLARHGSALTSEHFTAATTQQPSGPTAWLGASGELIAVGSRDEHGRFVVRRGFATS